MKQTSDTDGNTSSISQLKIEWYWTIQANFYCSGHRTTSKKNLLEPLLKKRQEINLCNEAKTWRKRAEVFMAQWGPPLWILRLTTNRFLALTKKCYHWCWLNNLEMHYLRWTTTLYYNQGGSQICYCLFAFNQQKKSDLMTATLYEFTSSPPSKYCRG